MLLYKNDWAIGSQLPQSKLSEPIVARVRKEYREVQRQIRELEQEFSVKAYAEHYGVAEDTMSKAIRGVTWRDV